MNILKTDQKTCAKSLISGLASESDIVGVLNVAKGRALREARPTESEGKGRAWVAVRSRLTLIRVLPFYLLLLGHGLVRSVGFEHFLRLVCLE